MKQLLQNYKTGELKVEEVPVPVLKPRGVLVKNHYSVVSAGTERAMLEFAKENLLSQKLPDTMTLSIKKEKSLR